MARVVVVGGGFAGLSAAARLAKLRHSVTLIESSERLGGRLHGVTVDGITWPLDLDTVTLPGVFRDLFRKSGRTLDQTLDLTKTVGRRHVFADRTTLDLPLGNRGDQHAAIMETFGVDTWSPWVDTYPDIWDVLRRTALDQVFSGRSAVDSAMRRTLRPRRSLATLARKDLGDDRLRALVLDPLRLAGHDRRLTPGFAAVSHYVERNFGRWRFDGGLPALASALIARAEQRRVEVVTGEAVHDILRTDRQVHGVVTGTRSLAADVVVWCAPAWPTSLAQPPHMPVIPASRTLIVLAPGAPELADEILVHADPPIRMWSGGAGAWTIEHRSGEDPLHALVRVGIDLRPHVVHRTDLTPSDLVSQSHWGWTWNRWTSALSLPGVGARDGLYFAGSHAHPGGSLEAIGMATAAIAADVGAAAR